MLQKRKKFAKTACSGKKIEELEMKLWITAGRPEGGPVQFRLQAREQLNRAFSGEEGA